MSAETDKTTTPDGITLTRKRGSYRQWVAHDRDGHWLANGHSMTEALGKARDNIANAGAR